MTGRLAVHQLLSGFADGDAISHAALTLRNTFRKLGHASDVFVEEGFVSPSMMHECRPLGEYRGKPGEVVVHHYGIASRAQHSYLESPARRIMVFHNITPPEYYDGFDDRVAAQLRAARAALPDIIKASAACWAVSAYNAAELTALGASNVRVFPLVFDAAPLNVAEEGPVADRFLPRLTTWLSVGRLAPNKALETLIEAFNWYHRTLNPHSRLMIIGSPRSCPRYYALLRMLVGDFDLANVCFEGFASPRGLPTYYRKADVLVSTSEHEGYCLPLLEAMHCGLPVVARTVGGVPEALDGAGVQYDHLSTAELALLVHRVTGDPVLRGRVLASQQRRMQAVAARDLVTEVQALLAEAGMAAIA
jgi:glycosyltransferase involved in cell wall biosynthesis